MAGGTFQRRHTMASRHEDPVEYCISDKVVERSSTREKLTQGMTSRRRSYSEPAYYSSTFTDFFPDSEGMLGSHLHLGTSDDRMGESWDDAKRFLIESRKLDLEISKDVERVTFNHILPFKKPDENVSDII
ncbi:unnamed protein product [Thelazia callipaeda]|uniref:PHM7_ext domain-containing protein n=1 Tax=Thelazia callipaeda TaxID=103827 RepID=A0A0N5CXG6_THECL|nr:unnamed protein product [Thelazia callipaeda]